MRSKIKDRIWCCLCHELRDWPHCCERNAGMDGPKQKITLKPNHAKPWRGACGGYRVVPVRDLWGLG